jgi:chromate reductase
MTDDRRQPESAGSTQPVRILGIAGSLRRGSYNQGLLRAAIELAPPDVDIETFDIGTLPLHNEDLREGGDPETVVALKAAMARADAILFVTPEHNRSIPGVLKNAIDVASRPYGKSSFLGKPVGIISNSPGPLGGVSAAKHLQNVLPGITGPIMGQPETYLTAVGDAFNEKGELTKEPLQKVLQQFLEAFAAFVEKQHR